MRKIIMLIVAIFLINCTNSKKEIKENNSILKSINFSKEKFTHKRISLDPKRRGNRKRIVQLETNSKCLVGRIKTLYYTDNKIIVFDGKQIFIFNNQGTFIQKIGKKGRGPNEYSQLTCMSYDDDSKHIEIYDDLKSRLLVYNLQGKLVQVKKSSLTVLSFIKTTEGYFVYSPFVKTTRNINARGYNLFLLDDNFNFTGSKFLPTKNSFDRDFDNHFSKNGSEILFHHGLNDTIYKITGNKVTPFLHVDFEENKVPYSKLVKMVNMNKYDEKVYYNTPSYIGSISGVLVNNNSVVFNFSKIKNGEKSLFFSSYNRNKDSVSFYNRYYSEIKGLKNPNPIYIDNDKVVYVAYPYEMYNNELMSFEKEYGIKINEGSNPILINVYE